MPDMVKLDRLAKRFGPVEAVAGVSFAMGKGEVLGFLGPNGAGKSTTMRMLTGFIQPSSGRAAVLGHDVVEEPIAVKRCIGYLPEGAPLYGDMSVAGFLGFVAEMRGFSGERKRRAIAAAVEKTTLAEVLPRPIETLSKGFKRRVGLAQAILHDPPVLILDEPTDGLDPNQKHEVRRLIAAMAADKAIIISTHILEEVEAICTRAIVIARGKVVADERPDALRRRSRFHNAVRLTVRMEDAERAAAALSGIENVAAVERAGTVGAHAALLAFAADQVPIVGSINDRLRRDGIAALEVTVAQGHLDDVFGDLTGRPDIAVAVAPRVPASSLQTAA